ncbi:TonB-dependent receptor domain-containing protein [Vibrio sp. WJH972]
MKKTILAAAVASLLSPIYSVQAEDVSAQDTVVVTASRFEQTIDSTTAAVSVITREEIEASQATELISVLNTLPSLQIAANGGMGSTQRIFVRGTSSDHTLVLIDGVRTGSATTGSVNFSSIPLVAIERIEFLRGAGAAVYGADAIGGVINIITDSDREGGRVSASMGTDNYRATNGLVAGNLSDKLHASIAVSALKTDGFSAKSTPSDDDGYASRAVSLNTNYKLSSQIELGGLALAQKSEGEYDEGTNSKKVYNLSGYANYKNNSYETKLVLSASQDSSKDYSYDSLYETNRTQIAWQNQYSLSQDWVLSGGIDWNDDEVVSTVEYDESSRSNLALYLHSQFNTGPYALEAAVRTDENERYGSHNTWQLGAGYQFSPTYRVLANAGTAFKAPTFNDLYYPGYSNPDTKSEESINYEVAIEATYSVADFHITAYHNDIKNLIALDSNYIPFNYGKVEIEGIEFAAGFDIGQLSNTLSYDYTNAKDTETNEQLDRRAKHNVKWNSTYQVANWQFGMSYLYQSVRNDGSNTLDPYSLVNLTGAYTFDSGIQLSTKVGNIFNEDYETAYGYNTEERNVYATVNYSF